MLATTSRGMTCACFFLLEDPKKSRKLSTLTSVCLYINLWDPCLQIPKSCQGDKPPAPDGATENKAGKMGEELEAKNWLSKVDSV